MKNDEDDGRKKNEIFKDQLFKSWNKNIIKSLSYTLTLLLIVEQKLKIHGRNIVINLIHNPFFGPWLNLLFTQETAFLLNCYNNCSDGYRYLNEWMIILIIQVYL